MNGIILPYGKIIDFPNNCSYHKVSVTDISVRNHPAYQRKGDSKQLVANSFIEKYECIGYYGGEIVNLKKNDWNPYQLTPKDDEPYFIDGEQFGNNMRYINDHKGVDLTPNVGFFLADFKIEGYYITSIVALRNIEMGEEILASYGDGYWKSLKEWHERKNPYKCDECDYRTFEPGILVQHCKKQHEFMEKVKCEYCVRVFRDKYDLKHHMNGFHTKEKLYECEHCPFTTYVYKTFHSHCEKNHKKRTYKCFYCGNTYKSKHALSQHVDSIHEKTNNFKCKQCDYATAFRTFLKDHIAVVHSDENPYVCKICDKEFTAKMNLQKHNKSCK